VNSYLSLKGTEIALGIKTNRIFSVGPTILTTVKNKCNDI
jgi:hypothetical protein